MPLRTAAALLTLCLLAACGADQPTASPPRPSGTPAQTPFATPPASPAQPTATPAGQAEPPAVAFEPVLDGLENLTFLTHAGDGSGLVYLVEQRGMIRVATTDGQLREQPFLDITDRVGAGGERGLLGLAFHPDFADSRRLFVNYSTRNGANVVAEFRAGDGSGEPADPASEREMLRIDQPFPNHNGGMLAFGADGMLYISSGDGGGGGDPLDAGQGRTTLLGKILRIDVDSAQPYAAPPDNPYADGADGARPEIWAHGLRNPWRFSFDRQTGDLFIADVGQDRWEEVNAEPAGEGGRNYGWNTMEGPDCFGQADCDRQGLVMPVAWYETGADCAITGGYVYRGDAVQGLAGFYLYSDYCSGRVWALDAQAALTATQPPVETWSLGDAGVNVTGFGEDEAGELYLVSAAGEVLRAVAGD